MSVNTNFLTILGKSDYFGDFKIYIIMKIKYKHDLIKSKWCKENNIPLIRIPYTHFDNLCLNDLLLETSNFIEK